METLPRSPSQSQNTADMQSSMGTAGNYCFQ